MCNRGKTTLEVETDLSVHGLFLLEHSHVWLPDTSLTGVHFIFQLLPRSSQPNCPTPAGIYSIEPFSLVLHGCEVLGVCRRRRRWGRVRRSAGMHWVWSNITQSGRTMSIVSACLQNVYFGGQFWLFSSFSRFKARGLLPCTALQLVRIPQEKVKGPADGARGQAADP